MQPFPTHTLWSNAVAPTGAISEELPGGSIGWSAAEVNPADQLSFENALDGVAASGPHSFAPQYLPPMHVSKTTSTNLGESILNTLAGIKQHGQAIKAEMVDTLSRSDLSSGDLLAAQFKLMSLSIELQSTSNMAHHGVEDVKTIMRGQ